MFLGFLTNLESALTQFVYFFWMFSMFCISFEFIISPCLSTMHELTSENTFLSEPCQIDFQNTEERVGSSVLVPTRNRLNPGQGLPVNHSFAPNSFIDIKNWSLKAFIDTTSVVKNLTDKDINNFLQSLTCVKKHPVHHRYILGADRPEKSWKGHHIRFLPMSGSAGILRPP